MELNRRVVIYLICIICVISCQSKERQVETSFYYWKQQFAINNAEQIYLNDLKVKKIYIKFFDINKNNDTQQTEMIAPVYFAQQPAEDINIIPTVFITNKTLIHSSLSEISGLVDYIYNNIQTILKKNEITNVKTIQIDCDWSLSTKEKYFKLLSLLKNKMQHQELSATIRLHQIKFHSKTGIPPVDRGTLMFYNMDDVTADSTENSILDLSVAKQYFYNFDTYTLPLDVALPLFRWGVLIRRGRVIQLLNHLMSKDLDPNRFQELKKNQYQVLESHYFKGYYLYKGDKIRLENVPLEDLIQASKLLETHIKRDTLLNLTYYHLDSLALQHYSVEDVKNISKEFKKH